MPAQHINAQQFQEIFQESKYVLVDFYAEWCPPCKMMAPIIDSFSEDEDLADITFVKIDTDQENALAGQFGIMSIPTFILFKATEGGGYEEVQKFIGGQEPISFKTKLQEAVSGG